MLEDLIYVGGLGYAEGPRNPSTNRNPLALASEFLLNLTVELLEHFLADLSNTLLITTKPLPFFLAAKSRNLIDCCGEQTRLPPHLHVSPSTLVSMHLFSFPVFHFP